MNVSDIPKKIEPAKQFVIQHVKLLAFIAIMLVFGFMVLRIYQLASVEPTDSQIDEKISSLRLTKLDQSAVDVIQSLEDRNISIESLFDNGRTNPFEQ